jgi:hypothetical protein
MNRITPSRSPFIAMVAFGLLVSCGTEEGLLYPFSQDGAIGFMDASGKVTHEPGPRPWIRPGERYGFRAIEGPGRFGEALDRDGRVVAALGKRVVAAAIRGNHALTYSPLEKEASYRGKGTLELRDLRTGKIKASWPHEARGERTLPSDGMTHFACLDYERRAWRVIDIEAGMELFSIPAEGIAIPYSGEFGASFVSGGGTGVYDLSGKIAWEAPGYEALSSPVRGLCALRSKATGLAGWADGSGNIAIACAYSYASPFAAGFAYAERVDGFALLVDTSGATIVELGMGTEYRGAFFGRYVAVSIKRPHENRIDLYDINGVVAISLPTDAAPRPADSPGAYALLQYRVDDGPYRICYLTPTLDVIGPPGTEAAVAALRERIRALSLSRSSKR